MHLPSIREAPVGQENWQAPLVKLKDGLRHAEQLLALVQALQPVAHGWQTLLAARKKPYPQD